SAPPAAPGLQAVALKEIQITSWRSLAREVIALLRCGGHPNVVHLHRVRRIAPDLQSPLDRAQLTMEYAAYGNLATLASCWAAHSEPMATGLTAEDEAGEEERDADDIASSTRAQAAQPAGLPERMCAHYLRQLVHAVMLVHSKHIAHCDIKGANLLLMSDGQLRLSDFGSCYIGDGMTWQELEAVHEFLPASEAARVHKATREAEASHSDHKLDASDVDVNEDIAFMLRADVTPRERGTLRWTAPEILLSSAQAPCDASLLGILQAADVWSIGCTLLELLTGTPPWWWAANNSGDVRVHLACTDVRASLPDWLSPAAGDFIRACLHPDAFHRPTAIQLLRHPFVRGYDDVLSALPMPSSLLLAAPATLRGSDSESKEEVQLCPPPDADAEACARHANRLLPLAALACRCAARKQVSSSGGARAHGTGATPIRPRSMTTTCHAESVSAAHLLTPCEQLVDAYTRVHGGDGKSADREAVVGKCEVATPLTPAGYVRIVTAMRRLASRCHSSQPHGHEYEELVFSSLSSSTRD
ncbi:MAG: hypothetical protein EOO41_03305, partial [Methanobacteriota archaeon]